MNEIFATIYELLMGLYGQSLGYFLYGFDCNFEVVNQSGYAYNGLIMIGITMFFAIAFYYIINSAAFSRWYHWLIMLFINAGVNFYIAYNYVSIAIDQNSIPECFLRDPQTNASLITHDSYIGLGVANLIVSIVFFILISFSIRWWSKNASTTPFPS